MRDGGVYSTALKKAIVFRDRMILIKQSDGITLLSSFDWLMSCYSRATDDPADESSVGSVGARPLAITTAPDTLSATSIGTKRAPS
jgi:hypothetical protein